MEMNHYDLDPHECPTCHYKMNAATNLTGQRGPKPGDLTVCFSCGQPLCFGDKLQLELLDFSKVESAANLDMLMRASQLIKLTQPLKKEKEYVGQVVQSKPDA